MRGGEITWVRAWSLALFQCLEVWDMEKIHQRKVRRSIGFKPSRHHVERTRERAGIRLIDGDYQTI